MEYSPTQSLPPNQKRKASPSPIPEHCYIPQEGGSPANDRTVLHETQAASLDQSSLYGINDSNEPKPKRQKLSLDSLRANISMRSRSRKPMPSQKRSRSRPTSQSRVKSHDIIPSYSILQEQQYLLHHRPSLPPTNRSLLSPLSEFPIASSPVITAPPQIYVPPFIPTITRDTLRELDLEAILKNPQLRHDLLFDPGLQFRPTAGRRKQLITERYWAAVSREVEFSCTCSAWDASGILLSCRCFTKETDSVTEWMDSPWSDRLRPRTKRLRARPPTPPPWSDRYYAAYLDAAADPRLDNNALKDECPKEEEQTWQPTHGLPSRIGPMLRELVAVLGCVIAPPPLPAANASSQRHSPTQSADVHNLLAHFDQPLIEQELRRNIFEPVGLFSLVGETLKRHCAPMRDRQVDAMVKAARDSENSASRRAITTIRMCFEVLESMKLDIANHQLQHLRPFLTTSTPDFELRIFIERCRRRLSSPRITREWLQNAWDKVKADPTSAALILENTTTAIPRAPSVSHRMLVQLSLINAMTGLVFNPPSSGHPSCPPTASCAGYPETLYLDTARVALLAADAADLTALYMLLMLWRQLVFWSPTVRTEGVQNKDVFPPYIRASPRLENWEMDRVKREIWEVGPRRIGSCFLLPEDESAEATREDRGKWTRAMQNVTLQIAMRAEEARTCTSTIPTTSSASTRQPPSREALELMGGWVRSHMRRRSALAVRLRELLRQEVVRAVTRLTVGVEVSKETVPGSNGVKAAFIPGSGGGTAGLEPLMPEVRHMAQRLAKLVLVNMKVYWSLYEADGFLVDKPDVEKC